MDVAFQQLAGLYQKIVQYMNLITFGIAIIAFGFAVWLSQKEGIRKSSMGVFLSFLCPGLGQIYIKDYFIGGLYIFGTFILVGVGTPLSYLHLLFVISTSIQYGGFFKTLIILFLWFHSIWFVDRMIRIRNRMNLMSAMYGELHQMIHEGEKIKKTDVSKDKRT